MKSSTMCTAGLLATLVAAPAFASIGAVDLRQATEIASTTSQGENVILLADAADDARAAAAARIAAAQAAADARRAAAQDAAATRRAAAEAAADAVRQAAMERADALRAAAEARRQAALDAAAAARAAAMGGP